MGKGTRSAACTSWLVTYEQRMRDGSWKLVGPNYTSWKTLELLRGFDDVRVIEVEEVA